MKYFVLVFFFVLALFSVDIWAGIQDDWLNEDEIQQSILRLHTKSFKTRKGEIRENIVWGECQKQLRGDEAFRRSKEYARAIVGALQRVHDKTGERIDPDHMIAILYRESSYNECVIGRKETKRLKERLGRSPTKSEFIMHVKKWTKVYINARKNCKRSGRFRELPSGKSVDARCTDNIVGKTHPEYKGIYGWDLGAAQYRWPGPSFRRRARSLVLPSGRVLNKVGLKDIFNYEVSINMLADDMAKYKGMCKTLHKHKWVSKWGKYQRVKSEEAYFAHHHTGPAYWSARYWKAVRRHLAEIKKGKQKSLLAKKSNNNSSVINL